MIFSSMEFLLIFLPLFLLIYRLTPDRNKNVTLLAGSLVFYALGEPKYLVLLLCSVLVNHKIGLYVGRDFRQGPEPSGRKRRQNRKKKGKGCRNQVENKKRRRLLAAAVVLNVGLLAGCKAFLKDLPLGISFYTFQVLSYLIDLYRGEQAREMSRLKFAVYVTMFPRLVSGPIVSYGEVREDLGERKLSAEGLQEGLKVFTLGLAAKVLLADRLGFLWQEVQVTGFESISTPLAWIAAVGYSMKIYFDFYGYSLMAVGLGRMLGFSLPENFRTPYAARSIRDFYRRWHVTLGRWFCKYVYVPLGGSRRGGFRTTCNLLAVWLLTALWHGSTVNFLLWGLLLWLLIVLERRAEAFGWGRFFRKGPLRAIPHLYLWLVIPVTWMCFAVTDTAQLQVYLGRMFGVTRGIYVSAGDWLKALGNYWYLFGIGALACTPALEKLFRRWKDTAACSILLAVLFWTCVWRLQAEGQNPFMYSGF